MAGKKLTHCKKGHEFTIENILINKSTGRRRCKICEMEYRQSHSKQICARSRRWALDHPERTREIERRADHKRYPKRLIYRRDIWWAPYLKKLREEALSYYGNHKLACVCCGETIHEFLTLDHIKGRKETKDNGKGGWMLLLYLRTHKFPSGYQTLCWNCNSGRSNNGGICPHKTNKIILFNNTYRSKNPSKRTLAARIYHPEYVKKLRTEVLTHYGNGKLACKCCGIDKIQFLNIDHINGRTEIEKKNSKKRGWQFMSFLRSHGYPSGYQTLCWNCNSGRQLNKGICPHKI